jgi:heavy metal sensor kinase
MTRWARVPGWAGRALRVTRSLRFRLTLTYVLFFTLLLVMIGLLFRPLLRSIMYEQVDEALDEEWGAAKGYLHYFAYGWDWFFDPYDSEESLIVRRLQHVFLMADSSGNPIEKNQVRVSDTYRSIGVESPAEIRARLRRLSRSKQEYETRYDQDGSPYRIRTGILTDREQHQYYMAVGRSVTEEERTLNGITIRYVRIVPLLIALSSIWGWFMAGRALRPVNSVAHAAQRISGSNLSVRIPSRGAGDELDHLIATFNGMMDRLGVSFEKIRQFSTDVSHELRTPLTVIRGQLEVALLSAKCEEQYREAMLAALEDVERLSHIVRALLLLSQSETGQLVLHKTELDLAAMTHDFVEEFQVSAEEKRVRLTADLPPACPMHGDRIQIERLLSNLLSNAVKYTPEGGSVHVRLGRESGIAGSEPTIVRLTVEDTGVGIPAEHLRNIFDRFYKVPSADSEKGLGLGLSFVAWIVKTHGGTIDVQSRVNEGSRFTVTLPAAEA